MSVSEDINRRKLIDRLVPDDAWGPMVGLVTTTYEMQPDFLELDFLPSLFRLGAWDDRSWATRVGMERKLAELEVAAIFMDPRCYRGRPRSLRLALFPVRLQRGSALHAKVTLVLFERAVRIIVGSANLTEQGFRKNREIVAELTATDSSRQEARLILQAAVGMEAFLEPWLTPEAREVLIRAREMATAWSASPKDDQAMFQWSGGTTKLWQEFLNRWPSDDSIRQAIIVSPFWSADARTTLEQFITNLRSRNALDANCEFRLLTEAFVDPSRKYLPILPQAYATCDWQGLGINISAQAVDPGVLPEEVGDMEGFTGIRRLHAKVVLLQGSRTNLAYLGSANFTAHGWGFLQDGAKANIEAGLIVRRSARNEGLRSLLPGTIGDPVELTSANTMRLRSPEGECEAIPWPDFLKACLLTPKNASSECLQLQVEVEPGSQMYQWSIRLPEKDALPAQVLLTSDEPQHAIITTFKVDLAEDVLNRLLIEQELIMCWDACPGGRAVPLNVSRQARDRLPISPGRHRLEENHLLSYYQGKITWEDLFPDPEPFPGDQNGKATASTLSVVDKSKIQSYQIREFVEALRGIQDDLKRATESEPCMRLSLLGAVSPVSLARTVIDAVACNRRTATAAGFQLTEILVCLLTARQFQVRSRLAAQWLQYVDRAMNEVEGLLEKLIQDHSNELGADTAFKRYSRAVLRKNGSA